jgi:hypothetical protein
MMRAWVLLTLGLTVGCFAAPVNLVRNPDFVGDRDRDGLADDWEYSAGGSQDKLAVSFAREETSPGKFAQKITCSRYEGGHAMICQVGVVKVSGGAWYEMSLRARGENLSSATIGLHDTNGWKALSPWMTLDVGKRWRQYRFKFQADHDAHATTRFQIWFTTTGTLWVSDPSLTETQTPPEQNIIPDVGAKNLLPNSGFEAFGGWGVANLWTYGWERAATQGVGGGNCAAVKWTPGDPGQRYRFDYLNPTVRLIQRPALQAIGYVPLKAGETYTLSAYMRSDREGAPAMLGFRGPGASADRKVKLGAKWQRYSLTCKASGDKSIVQVGADFTLEDRASFEGATVYVDSVQLERGSAATRYEPRPLEAFAQTVTVRSPDLREVGIDLPVGIVSAQAAWAKVTVALSDFADRPAGVSNLTVPVNTGATDVEVPVRLPGPGFYRAAITVEVGARKAQTSVRCAVHPGPVPEGDSAFGINHAYGYDAQLRLARDIGISWVRDWSLQWEHVEPQRGRYTFDGVDEQVRRGLQQGMHVLCMFPFPSAEWSSSARPEIRTTAYPGNRIRQAFAPTDVEAMKRWQRKCVEQYRGDVKVWEVFNESIYTSYSLPAEHGYKAEDYVPLLKASYEACKSADPDCIVLGGYSAPPGRTTLYEPMFRGGGLEACDRVSLHIYPGGAPEHMDADLRGLNALMDCYGGRKGTWMTEYAYYGDDDPDPVKRTWPALLESEWQQACYNTRACVMMLGNGVEKIFYHIWPTSLNQDVGSVIFWEYAGAPRKIAVAQAAMRQFLGAAPTCVGRIPETSEEIMGFVFTAPDFLKRRGYAHVAAMWERYDPVTVRCVPGAAYFDLCGRALAGPQIELTQAPVWVALPQADAAAATKALLAPLQEAKLL